jgi:DNA-binding MarR family transcriptional regulator
MPGLKLSVPINNDEVLTQEEAQELARLLALLLQHDPSGRGVQNFIQNSRSQPQGTECHNLAHLVEKARLVFNERKRRGEFLTKKMLGEPGWDILLVLYISGFSGPKQTVGSVSERIAKPLTTTIRWVNELEGEGLIVRTRHPLDSRIFLLALTDKGRQVLDDYFTTMSFGAISV